MQPHLRVYDEWIMGLRTKKKRVPRVRPIGRPATGRKTGNVSVRIEREEKLRFMRKVRKEKLKLSSLFTLWLENITPAQLNRFASRKYKSDKGYQRGKQKLRVGGSVSKIAFGNFDMLPEGGARSALLRNLIRKFLKKK